MMHKAIAYLHSNPYALETFVTEAKKVKRHLLDSHPNKTVVFGDVTFFRDNFTTIEYKRYQIYWEYNVLELPFLKPARNYIAAIHLDFDEPAPIPCDEMMDFISLSNI